MCGLSINPLSFFFRSRFLRKTDRDKNGPMSFPKLFYPELYLLDGGYKAFFEKHPVSNTENTSLHMFTLTYVVGFC